MFLFDVKLISKHSFIFFEENHRLQQNYSRYIFQQVFLIDFGDLNLIGSRLEVLSNIDILKPLAKVSGKHL